MNHVCRSLFAVLTTVMLFAGCSTSVNSNKVNYVVGATETARVVKTSWHQSWVDMPKKPKQQKNEKKRISEIVYTTKVDRVEADGSALVTLTFDEVTTSVAVNTTSKTETNKYSSNSVKTETTSGWATEPKLAGESIQFKVASNSEIVKIIDLDGLRKKLKVSQNSIVASLLSEKRIKDLCEHTYMINNVENGQVIAVVVPDPTIKDAKAIENTYTIVNDGASVLTSYNGEAAYVLPEGVAKPPKPSHAGLGMIIAMSEIDSLAVTGEASYNIDSGRVEKDNHSVKCVLMLLSSDLSSKFNKGGNADDGGEMYTVSILTKTFEVIK